ncbi:MAG: GntR family transcriptional regulator [Coprobacillaceae bacterium]
MSKKIPLYATVLDVVKQRIIDGEYAIDSLLPTETELEKEFNVSKITVRKAIQLLENDGYVKKQSGKGTTIISNSIFNKISKGESFSNILRQQGCRIQKEKTKVETLSLSPQDDLYRYFKGACTRITREYYLDGEPYIHMTHYIPANVNPIVLNNQNNFSLYMHLYKSDYKIDTFEDSFCVEYPPLETLDCLEMEKGPALGRKRITYDHNCNVIEVSYAYYNTKKHPYQINYQV